jgi:ATP-dependent DNA helicase RecG
MLRNKPAGRRAVITRLLPQSRYGEVVERLAAAVHRGEKAYWICPLIDIDDELLERSAVSGGVDAEQDMAVAAARFKEFSVRFRGCVGLVHGRMNSHDRQLQMQKFLSGEIKVLVATTVVEVGVDIPDATIIVIEQAQRFGLSTLHQLRGRVGRSDRDSYCLLLYDDSAASVSSHDPVSSAFQRLSILKESDNGFDIAEADLRQRGRGDLIGVRQTGANHYMFNTSPPQLEALELARSQAQNDTKQALNPALDVSRSNLLRLFGLSIAPHPIS